MSIASNNLEPALGYGRQLQPLAIAGHQPESGLSIDYRPLSVRLKDGTEIGLRKPGYRLIKPAYGPLHPGIQRSPRLAPVLVAPGLLDAIPEAAILARADPQDRDQDGISGRISQVWSREQQRRMIGRFGHKAELATLNEQIQQAFTLDMGLSTPLYPNHAGDCTAAQVKCRQAPHGASPEYDDLEIHQTMVDWVGYYLRHLKPPVPGHFADPDVRAGQALFNQIGCARCHTPDWRFGDTHIQPYTDLLLHDMGAGLADDRGAEWRTAPLWGLHRMDPADACYLHDGRARNLLEAILWHGGEAQAQRDAVLALNAVQRNQLIRFIEHL